MPYADNIAIATIDNVRYTVSYCLFDTPKNDYPFGTICEQKYDLPA